MSNILDKICAHKRAHIDACCADISLAEIEKRAYQAPPPRAFTQKLKAKINEGQIGLIAEIKKASPSKGLIRPDFQPANLARAYEIGGASCLSILTDTPYFQGRNEDLIAARQAVDLPVLRKDFMLDPYQIFEARAIGADCILLIVAILEDEEMLILEKLAHKLGMAVLVEVHDRDELERALKLATPLIGINNRNLKTFDVNLATSETLAKCVPEDRILISESGLSTGVDIARMTKSGIYGFLIGESLMRQGDVTTATQNLLHG